MVQIKVLKEALQKITLGLSLIVFPFYDSLALAQTTPQSENSSLHSSEQLDNINTELLKLVVGRSSNTENDTILEPYMIVTNAASARRLLHRGLSLVEPEQQGILGLFQRASYIGLDYYLEYLLSVSAHELGHYGEMIAGGISNPNIELNSLWKLQYGGATYSDSGSPTRLTTTPEGLQVLQQDTNYEVTSQEKMAIAGRGETIELLLASEMLKEVAKRNRKINVLEASSYLWNHGKILKAIGSLTSGSYGSVDIYNAGADADIVAYNRYSLLHKLFPYSIEDPRWENYPRDSEVDQIIENLPANIQKPSSPEEEIQLYNYILMQNYLEGERKFKDIHQIGVRIFSFLDFYHLTSAYTLGKYLITGDKDQQLPPFWVPQFNGYLGVPGPQYGVAWYIPTKKGLFNTELRLGISPELASAVGVGIDDLKIPRTKLYCNISGELIFQRDGTPVDDSKLGGTVTTEVMIPIGNTFSIGTYYLYQSEGVWSPYRFGLKENHTVGLALSASFFK